MEICKICSGDFENSPDQIILCEYKAGFVHLGCCINNCSMDKNPCIHCKSKYTKEIKK